MAFRISAGIFVLVLVCPAGWRWRVADARVGAHELHPGQVQSGPDELVSYLFGFSKN